MPTISKGDKVLVTGANGYIAMWVTRLLLERGYAVRGTVRSEDKAQFMKNYFNGIGIAEKLETVVVEDIIKDRVFDEAVKGVDAIAHMASPFHIHAKEPSELIGPAVQGTVGILKSTVKNGQNVKRIAITSSAAAIMSDKPGIFSEADWNIVSTKEVEEKGSDASPVHMYRASKTLAEKGMNLYCVALKTVHDNLLAAAWEYHERHKNEVTWDLTTLNPPYPAIHDVSSVARLNTSLKMWYNHVVAGNPSSKDALSDSESWVDVRDIALAHVLALEKSEAAGERIVITEGIYTLVIYFPCPGVDHLFAGGYIWQEWLAAANSLTPSPIPSHNLPVGYPEILDGEPVSKIRYNKSKEERILGIKFHTKVETTKDTLEDFATRGW
ncbi:hypothetical protein CVT25_003200 [Psilocybe cyanescens]|uniref:NAD-dependent epimerase/dehydratase domain-containing protein n=1 Tax=Psilocybe cyanescens TaxID=93625 RepID=A0A409XF17_PSICY|nr:hypothetical protein CVT25_003200 [Psilocybe cyanescens]